MGIHPWYIENEKIDNQFLDIKNNITTSNFLAIGECGLDKMCKTDFAAQKKIFLQHVELSEEFKKPLIIHCVKAYQDIIEIKNTFKPTQDWIFHGFNKKEDLAILLIKNNCYLSFGNAIITNNNLRNIFSKIPLENIFFETDNSEYTITEIYEKASEIVNKDIEILEKIIENNFLKVFKK